MIYFRGLGAIDLRSSDGELGSILSQPKRLALFAWLVLEKPRGFQSRDRARALFWPEQDDAHARRALNRAIYWLRQSLGEGVLQSRGDEEIGVPLERCMTDVAAFESATIEGRFTEAAELYRGDLLRGFFVSAAPDFEHWLDAERERLRHLAHKVGRALIEADIAADNRAMAVHWARWTLERFPSDEPTLCRLMMILDAAGDRAGAVQAYDQFVARLSAELELPPSSDTQALAATIRAGTHRVATVQPELLARQPARALPLIASADNTIAAAEPVQNRSSPVTRGPSPKRARIALAMLGVVVAVLLTGLVLRSTRHVTLDPQRVLVFPFENRTGDAAFDALGQMTSDRISHGLAQTGSVETVALPTGGARARAMLALVGMNGTRAAARRAGAGTMVHGAIYRAGTQLRFEASVTSVLRGDAAWTVESIHAPVDSTERAINEIRDRTSGASAVLMNPRFASWLPRATTTPPTFDAFKEFARGDELMLYGRAADALAHLRRAATLDPTFTFARVQTSAAYLNLADAAGADSIARALERVRERLTPVALAWLVWIRAVIEEDEADATRAMKRAAALAPDRFLFLYAESLRWLNRPAEIVALLAPAGSGSPYHDGRSSYSARLAEAYHQLGEHEKELTIATRMRSYEPTTAQGLWAEIRALTALGRTNDVMARLSAVESLPRQTSPSAGQVLREAAEELRAHGQPQAAAIALDHAIAWYHGLPREAAARASNRFQAARALYLVGKLDQAESHFRQLIIDNPLEWPEYEGALGVIAARRGDRKTAQQVLAALERQRLASDPPPKHVLYAQARIVARLGDSERAVRLLREALGGQGRDLHMDSDFEMLVSHPGFKELIRAKG